jgi:hypothetical protein
MEYATRERFGGLGLKTTSGGFTGLGLKTRAEVPRRNRRHVAASGSSRRGEATGEEARWPSVTEPPNYDGPHVPVIIIVTSDSRTYVPHNLKGLLSSEQDPITGVLQYYNSLFKYHQSKVAEVLQ